MWDSELHSFYPAWQKSFGIEKWQDPLDEAFTLKIFIVHVYYLAYSFIKFEFMIISLGYVQNLAVRK